MSDGRGINRAAFRLGQAQARIAKLGGRTARDGELASILNDLEDALTEAQITQDELTRRFLPTETMSWRDTRALLQDSGRGVNEAQDILEDLAHWGPEHHGHSVRTPEGSVLRLRYAGLDEHKQPTYTTKVTYTPPQEGDSQ